ncbi:MAG: roadblock/LC7 domain-containing protein [Promethearchaeota archaeon]
MVNQKEKQIQLILKGFRQRTGIISSTLFDDDGLLMAIDQAAFIEDEEYHESIGAICANIVSLAESGLLLIKNENNINQVLIQAGNQLDQDGFIIILQSITSNIILAIIFQVHLNLGVILFELNQISEKLIRYFEDVELSNNLGDVKT